MFTHGKSLRPNRVGEVFIPHCSKLIIKRLYFSNYLELISKTTIYRKLLLPNQYFLYFKNLLYCIFLILSFNYYYHSQYKFFFLTIIMVLLIVISNKIWIVSQRSQPKFSEKFVYANAFILVFCIINIITNIFRFIFQDAVLYFRQGLMPIDNVYFNFFIDSAIPIIAWQTTQALFVLFILVYLKFHVYDTYIERFFAHHLDLNKNEMVYPNDYLQTYMYKYRFLYAFCCLSWRFSIFIIGINTLFKLDFINTQLHTIIAFIIIFGLVGELVFNLNNYYVVYKYFKKY